MAFGVILSIVRSRSGGTDDVESPMIFCVLGRIVDSYQTGW